MTSRLTNSEYAYLLELRTGLRRFVHWSEEQARAAGLTPSQHQLLLAIRGHRGPYGPAIGDIAQQLLLRHHSAVELVDRAEAAGMVVRCPDADHHRVVRLALTPEGAKRLEQLAKQHLAELAHLAPTMEALWYTLEQAGANEDRGSRHPAARRATRDDALSRRAARSSAARAGRTAR